jgi:alkyl hydroperoxide reductase subunit AhpC
MATLCLGEIDESVPLLRDWLAGDWALLFSHPADFEDQGLERDRWLEILRDEFRVRGVRPVACGQSADAGAAADDSWAGELIDDHRLLRLPSDAVGDGVIDLAARNLRADILGLPPRFVLIVDESLTRRGMLKYSAGRSSVSPLDLLASIDAFRRSSTPALAASPKRRIWQSAAA